MGNVFAVEWFAIEVFACFCMAACCFPGTLSSVLPAAVRDVRKSHDERPTPLLGASPGILCQSPVVRLFVAAVHLMARSAAEAIPNSYPVIQPSTTISKLSNKQRLVGGVRPVDGWER